MLVDWFFSIIGCGTLARKKRHMKTIETLFDNNKNWAREMTSNDPEFFQRLVHQQSPKFLWIGCSDSRVPANEIVGLLPGELFVHRNVANVVVHTDLNCLSVLQYAVDVLKVEHIILCGHYGCGGVQAALRDSKIGLIRNWLRHVQDVASHHRLLLQKASLEEVKLNLLCELNVIEQVTNVCKTTIVQTAWERKQNLSVHGIVYGIQDGILKNLQISVDSSESTDDAYQCSVDALVKRYEL